MMHYNELVPALAGDPVPHADRLRLAVAAYLARFKGHSYALHLCTAMHNHP